MGGITARRIAPIRAIRARVKLSSPSRSITQTSNQRKRNAPTVERPRPEHDPRGRPPDPGEPGLILLVVQQELRIPAANRLVWPVYLPGDKRL